MCYVTVNAFGRRVIRTQITDIFDSYIVVAKFAIKTDNVNKVTQ